MPGGLGPRFALEAGFLILLAAVAAYARLSATEIILVMAGGWLLASVFELVASRGERGYTGWKSVLKQERPRTQEPGGVKAAPREVERRRSWLRTPSETAVEPAPPEPVLPDPATPTQPDDADTGEIELAASKRRRWFGLRRASKSAEPGADPVGARPSSRHVRLITDKNPAGGQSERPNSEPEGNEDESRKDAGAGP